MKHSLNFVAKFDVKHVKTLGDLVPVFQDITECIVVAKKLRGKTPETDLAEILLRDFISIALKANGGGFKSPEQMMRLEAQRNLLVKYLSPIMGDSFDNG